MSRRRLLVAEDNVFLAFALRSVVELWGFEVSIVHDGWAALSAAHDVPPDVALIDIRLPGLGGLEVARRLRDELGPRTPLLIAVTGGGEEQDRRASLAAGFQHHLVKPIDLPRLRALLEAPSASLSPGA